MEISHPYKNEIPTKKIFEQMKECSYDFYKKNKIANLNLIIKNYLQIRNTMIILLKKVSEKLCFKSQTFFLSIYYLDIIKLETTKSNLLNNYISLALACLVIAAKYCENDPNVPQIPYFIRVYNSLVDNKYKNTIAISDIIYNEVKICKTLNYKLQYYTIYDYNSFLFGHGILKLNQIKEIKSNNKLPFPLYAKKILEKIYKKSRSYLDIIIHKQLSFKYNSLLISIYLMHKSVESVILSESKTNNDIEKMKIRTKTNKYFKEIMNNFYEIDYESMEEYHLMKREIESNKFRNKNNNQNINKSLTSIKTLKNNLTVTKINKTKINNFIINNDRKSIIISSYPNNKNNYTVENELKNSIKFQAYEETKIIPEYNNTISKTNYNNNTNERLNMINTQSYEFNNPFNTQNNSKKKISIESFLDKAKKSYNIGNKKIYKSNKYSKIESLNNSKNDNYSKEFISQYNNYTNNINYSLNFYSHKFNSYNDLLNKAKIKPKSISPKNIDNNKHKESLYINKNNKINIHLNSNIFNRTEESENENKRKDRINYCDNISSSLNFRNDGINGFNDNNLIDINKLYYKKILCNGGSKPTSQSKKKNNINLKKPVEINNYKSDIKSNERNGVISIKGNYDDNIYNLNKRYGNIFISANNSDNEDNEENDKDEKYDNNNKELKIDNYLSYKNDKLYNLKERINSEYKLKKSKILSDTFYPTSKTESVNTFENNYLITYYDKNNLNIKKRKSNYNLYSDHKGFLKKNGKYYENNDNKESVRSSSNKIKNIKRNKSKEFEFKKKKQSSNNNVNNKIKNNSNIQEYNIIKFLKNDINNNINVFSNSLNKKFINNNIKNNNNLIINNNINNNNLNKFDNEIISINYNSNLKNNLNLNSTDGLDIKVNKTNFNQIPQFNPDEIINKQNNNKNYSLSTSINQKKLSKKNYVLNNEFNNNKNLFSTIVINNNININLEKKLNSRKNMKYNNKIKFANNTFKGFLRNIENKLIKNNNTYKTTGKMNYKILKK